MVFGDGFVGPDQRALELWPGAMLDLVWVPPSSQ